MFDQGGWILDTFLFEFLSTSTSSRSIKTQKRTWPIFSHFDLALGQQRMYRINSYECLLNFSHLKCGAYSTVAFIWKLDATKNCFNYSIIIFRLLTLIVSGPRRLFLFQRQRLIRAALIRVNTAYYTISVFLFWHIERPGIVWTWPKTPSFLVCAGTRLNLPEGGLCDSVIVHEMLVSWHIQALISGHSQPKYLAKNVEYFNNGKKLTL